MNFSIGHSKLQTFTRHVCPYHQYEHNITFYSDIQRILNNENKEDFKAQKFVWSKKLKVLYYLMKIETRRVSDMNRT